jgi:hypothetical protein
MFWKWGHHVSVFACTSAVLSICCVLYVILYESALFAPLDVCDFSGLFVIHLVLRQVATDVMYPGMLL